MERSSRRPRIRDGSALHLSNTAFEELNIRIFLHIRSRSQKSSVPQAWLSNPAQLETVIMNPRLASMAALCREVAIPASVVAFAAFGPTLIDSIGAAPIVDRLAVAYRRRDVYRSATKDTTDP